MPQRARILLLIPHLGGGGAEQVMALVARGLSRERFEVHLCLATQTDVAAARLPPLPAWIAVHALGAKRVRAAMFPLLRLLWRLRPRAIFSGAPETNFLALLLRPLLPPGMQVLVRQSTTVSAALSSGRLPGYTRLLYRLLYRRADCVICQSRAMAADLASELGIGKEKIAVLPNPVDMEGILAARKRAYAWKGKGPHLLAVGRLSREKGFDLLIEALAAVRKRYPEADLLIAGAGDEEMALKEASRAQGLEAAVHFAGHVDCPYTLFPGATLFVLSSRYEGMPNALIEALAAGLPIVATPASGGVVDLLRGRADAWLTERISAGVLAATIVQALGRIENEGKAGGASRRVAAFPGATIPPPALPSARPAN